MIPPLHRDPLILSTLVGSTTARAAEVRDYLARAFNKQRAKEDGLTYAQRVRAGIRAAVSQLELDDAGVYSRVRRRIKLKGPALYGLDKIPNVETIADEIKHYRIEVERQKVSGSSPQPESACAQALHLESYSQHTGAMFSTAPTT